MKNAFAAAAVAASLMTAGAAADHLDTVACRRDGTDAWQRWGQETTNRVEALQEDVADHSRRVGELERRLKAALEQPPAIQMPQRWKDELAGIQEQLNEVRCRCDERQVADRGSPSLKDVIAAARQAAQEEARKNGPASTERPSLWSELSGWGVATVVGLLGLGPVGAGLGWYALRIAKRRVAARIESTSSAAAGSVAPVDDEAPISPRRRRKKRERNPCAAVERELLAARERNEQLEAELASQAKEYRSFPVETGLARMRKAFEVVAENHPQARQWINLCEKTYELILSGEAKNAR